MLVKAASEGEWAGELGAERCSLVLPRKEAKLDHRPVRIPQVALGHVADINNFSIPDRIRQRVHILYHGITTPRFGKDGTSYIDIHLLDDGSRARHLCRATPNAINHLPATTTLAPCYRGGILITVLRHYTTNRVMAVL